MYKIFNIFRMKSAGFFLVFFVLLIHSGFAQEKSSMEKLPKEERMKWWSEARFGMFIHWGIYSVPAGFYKGEAQTNSAEWIMNKGKIPLGEYEKFSDEFNPSKFDAKEFVGLAREAGMKYMVITSKHHDGFSMFDSKSNPFNVVNATPFKRDILKELAEECQKQGIKFGFYYSQAQDWSHPGGIGNTWDKKIQRVSNDVYVREKALPEVNQLLTEYGPIAIFWWDTPRQMTKEVVDSLYHITGNLQPGIITNDRLGEGYPGDFKTFERNLPTEKPDAPFWEICQPISGSWGYRSDDKNFKSAERLIRNLVDASSKGGNYLLNVSPTAEGTLLPDAVERLKVVGEWMTKNSEAIYKSEAGPGFENEWGYITMKTENKKATLYLNIFDWPANGQLPVQLKNKVASCYLLTDENRTFQSKTGKEGITISLTGKAPDSTCSVVVLKLNEMPNALPRKPLGQDETGNIVLPAKRAQFQNLDGPGAEYQGSKDCIGHWTSEKAVVYWSFVVDKPGIFSVSTQVAGLKDTNLAVSLADQNIDLKVPATGNYNKFEPINIGSFKVKKPGEYTITFKPVIGFWNPVNLKSLELHPIQK